MAQDTCQWPECDRPTRSRGLCDRDRKRAQAAGLSDTFGPPPRTCVHCDSPIPRSARGDARFCNAQCFRAAYRLTNLERETATQAAWYAANSELKRAYTSEWKSANRRRATDTESRRRARQAAAFNEPVSFQELWERDRGVCHICSDLIDAALSYPHPLSPSLDHVVPLARGGRHSMANAALSHLVCNMRKGDRALVP